MLRLSDLKFLFIKVRLSVELQVEDRLEGLIIVLIGTSESNCKSLKACVKFQISGTLTREELVESGRRRNWLNRYKINVCSLSIPYLFIFIIVSLLLENSFQMRRVDVGGIGRTIIKSAFAISLSHYLYCCFLVI